MPKIKYVAAFTDMSGYASAARGNVRSLLSAGANVSIEVCTFEPWLDSRLKLDNLGDDLRELLGHHTSDQTPDICIVHLTPDLYDEYVNSAPYRIGYYAWEASRLPDVWIEAINRSMHEAWVPSQYLADVSVKSGVTVPIHVFPHAIPFIEPCFIEPFSHGVSGDVYKFYSVFQLSERKNYKGLLGAFCQEFSRHERVALVLKTYFTGNSARDQEIVRREIRRGQSSAGNRGRSNVVLIDSILTESQMRGVHRSCDCYITMARSEGFGIPVFEAAAMGNPVIAPRYSAFPEHLNDSSAYLVEVPKEVSVIGMEHISPHFSLKMRWGDPSVASCRHQLREVFEHRDEAKARAMKAQQYVKENLSYEVLGKKMLSRVLVCLQGKS